MNYRIGSFKPSRNVVSKFIVAIQGDDLVFYATNPSVCRYHKQIATINGLDAENKALGGGGLVYLNDHEIELHEDSTAYGAVPKEVLEGFSDLILEEARGIRPTIKRVEIHPYENTVRPKWKPILEKLNAEK